MKTVFKSGFLAVIACLLWACSNDNNNDNNGNNNNNDDLAAVEFANSQRQFASMNCNFFKPDIEDYKGIISLGSGNDPEDPTAGSINDGYLISLAQKLASQGYLIAIVEYRDEPPVGANWENWTSNVAMLSTDLNDAANAMAEEFGLERSQIVLGGSSYAANALISHSAWGTGTFLDTRGFIAIMGSSALDTAQNIKSPILAFACNQEPFGTNYGKSLFDNINDATIKDQSFGYTDNSCSGHNTSNDWQDMIVEKVKNWLP
jgi:hypothetical protein